MQIVAIFFRFTVYFLISSVSMLKLFGFNNLSLCVVFPLSLSPSIIISWIECMCAGVREFVVCVCGCTCCTREYILTKQLEI